MPYRGRVHSTLAIAGLPRGPKYEAVPSGKLSVHCASGILLSAGSFSHRQKP